MRFLILLWGLIIGQISAKAQDAMPTVRKGSYTDYFAYFDPLGTSIPDYMKTGAGGGVMGIFTDSYNHATHVSIESNGTGFFIRTFRDDDKLCFCTAKHVLERLLLSLHPVTGTIDIYEKYYGRPNPNDPIRNETTSGYKSAIFPEVVSNVEEDVLLVLVHKPSITTLLITLLGYDFGDLSPNALLYTMGHPLGMPRKFSPSFTLSPSVIKPGRYRSSSLLEGYNVGCGSSGSPIIRQSSPNPTVVAIVTLGLGEELGIPPHEWVDDDDELSYFQRMGGYPIKVLEADIKKHCWQNKSEEELLQSGEYKKTEVKSNASLLASLYSKSISVASNADLLKEANATHTQNNPNSTLLTGQSVTISGLITPSTTVNDKIRVLSPTITLSAGFSYTPSSGTNELTINSVTVESAASASRRTGTTEKDKQEDKPQQEKDTNSEGEIVVYPNPTQGHFTVYVSTQKEVHGGNISVYSITGKKIMTQEEKFGINELDISSFAEGMYFIRVETKEGQLLYGGKVIKKN